MGLVAAGPAMHVAEPLYRRFDQRVGGLTESWKRRPFEHYVEGCRYNAAIARELIDESATLAPRSGSSSSSGWPCT